MNSLNKVARIVGILIPALALIAPFGMLIVPAQVELAFPLWLLFKGVRIEKKEGEQ